MAVGTESAISDVLARQLKRERDVIHAMQAKHDVWWRCFGLFWRKPWRAKHRPHWRRPADVLDWLRKAHDCADPAVGCSCSGGYRFP